MARAIQGVRNIQQVMIDTQRNTKQNCNFYRKELMIMQNLDMSNSSSFKVDELIRKMEFYAYLIDLYTMESLEEWLYLPDKKIKLKSISDLMYYEKLYGQTIYEEKEYEEDKQK